MLTSIRGCVQAPPALPVLPSGRFERTAGQDLKARGMDELQGLGIEGYGLKRSAADAAPPPPPPGGPSVPSVPARESKPKSGPASAAREAEREAAARRERHKAREQAAAAAARSSGHKRPHPSGSGRDRCTTTGV